MNHFFKDQIAVCLVYLTILTIVSNCTGTRPNNLGIRGNGELSSCPTTPNCVSSFTDPNDKEHFIQAIPYKQNLNNAVANLKDVFAKHPRAAIINESNQYIYAEFTTALMRYVDDVEFYFDDKKKMLHYRSASRLGKSDFGVNRKRIENIIIDLNWK
jgi:uncharacterized protein (DUF1499 family)